jgi:very-short-patch-repair endonuclease
MGESADARLARIAAEQFGVFTRLQAIEAGLTESTIDRRLATGLWNRLHHRVYCAGTDVSDPAQAAAAAAVAAGGAVSHLSAAKIYGLWREWPEAPHVLVAHQDSPDLRDVAVHRTRALENPDITWYGRVAVTSVERTVIDSMRYLGPTAQTIAVDEALRLGLTDPGKLAARCLALRRRGRTGPSDVLALLENRPPDASEHDSALESLFWRLVAESRLPGCVHHYRVRRRGGGTFELDFAWPDARVAVETDGGIHDRIEQIAFDAARDAELSDLGWIILRFRWADVIGRPDWCIAEIRKALKRSGRDYPHI